MIVPSANERQAALILDYVGKNYLKAPYLYINLNRYGVTNPLVRSWADQVDGKICGVYLLYFDCLHFFTAEPDYPAEHIGGMTDRLQPKVVMTHDGPGQRIAGTLGSQFQLKKNHVMDLHSVSGANQGKSRFIRLASREELPEIADLFLADPEYQGVYTKETLLAQLTARFDDGFSRSFVLEENHHIAASYSTYGETETFAMLSGLIVRPCSRRQGYATELIQHVCGVLRSEGKRSACLIKYDNASSFRLHKNAGGIPAADIFKYVRY